MSFMQFWNLFECSKSTFVESEHCGGSGDVQSLGPAWQYWSTEWPRLAQRSWVPRCPNKGLLLKFA